MFEGVSRELDLFYANHQMLAAKMEAHRFGGWILRKLISIDWADFFQRFWPGVAAAVVGGAILYFLFPAPERSGLFEGVKASESGSKTPLLLQDTGVRIEQGDFSPNISRLSENTYSVGMKDAPFQIVLEDFMPDRLSENLDFAFGIVAVDREFVVRPTKGRDFSEVRSNQFSYDAPLMLMPGMGMARYPARLTSLTLDESPCDHDEDKPSFVGFNFVGSDDLMPNGSDSALEIRSITGGCSREEYLRIGKTFRLILAFFDPGSEWLDSEPKDVSFGFGREDYLDLRFSVFATSKP